MRFLYLLVPAVASLFASTHGQLLSRDLIPYVPDAHTLHLWHLDEDQPPFQDVVNSATPFRGLHHGAIAGQVAIPRFGQCLSFSRDAAGATKPTELQGPLLTSRLKLTRESTDNRPSSFRYRGEDGAFSYEALVKLDQLPKDAPGKVSCILAMDDGGDGRIFRFHITRQGTLSFVPLANCGSKGGALAKIPVSGPHGINTSDWFHVAVTYSGNQNILNNLKLYWTRLSWGSHEANHIGSGTLTGDFNGLQGEFTLGNRIRSVTNPEDNEPEHFPGRIDEIRISSVARHPRDFILTPPHNRISPEIARVTFLRPAPGESSFLLANILVDGEPIPLPNEPQEVLSLGPGLHRLDIDFTYPAEQGNELAELRCFLEGVDERWTSPARGMMLICQVRDRSNRVISEAIYDTVGTSKGWSNSLSESDFTQRSEPFYIPAAGRALYIAMMSGSPDTTGIFAIDDLQVSLPGAPAPSIWANGHFGMGPDLTSPQGTPHRWSRRGDDPSIAQIFIDSSNVSLTLSDGDRHQNGAWACLQKFNPNQFAGRTVVLSWKETYNVIGGGIHRASYVNVPSGNYAFRAIGLIGRNSPTTASLTLPIHILPPFWKRPWFFPLLAGGSVALLAMMIYRNSRRHAHRRFLEMSYQHGLERERSRIARDMHDDLGTRISILNLSGSMALRDLEHNPENSRRHLGKMKVATRDLVVAMDDLVWAVDPVHDSLDQFGSHLIRMAEEIFRDSDIRCRLDIPTILPPQPLGSEFRHHLALAVKEALHNILQHAGPCEVSLSLRFTGTQILIEIRDTGRGFAQDPESTRHGIDNFTRRLEELGGSCIISSSPGEGACIKFSCPLSNKDTTQTS